MNFLKKLAFLSLFLCSNINNLYAAAAAEEQEQPFLYPELLDAVEDGTQLPRDVCVNTIMPYLRYTFPPLTRAWETPLPAHYRGAFVHQLLNKNIVIVSQDGHITHLNSANGALVKQSALQFQSPTPLKVAHVAPLHDGRFALGLESGDLSIVDSDNDGGPVKLFPSGHHVITGLVCAVAKGEKELVVGGDVGIFTFDVKTLQREQPLGYESESVARDENERTAGSYMEWSNLEPVKVFHCSKVSSMTLLPGKERVAFNGSPVKQSRDIVYIYDAATKWIWPTKIDLERGYGEVAVCGERLMALDNNSPHFSHVAQMYDPKNNFGLVKVPNASWLDLKAYIRSVATLPDAAAVLTGEPSFLKPELSGSVIIVGENNKILQRLPEKDVSRIAALNHGQLGTIFADNPAHVKFALLRPMSKQELAQEKEEKKEKEEKAQKRMKLAAAGAGVLVSIAAALFGLKN